MSHSSTSSSDPTVDGGRPWLRGLDGAAVAVTGLLVVIELTLRLLVSMAPASTIALESQLLVEGYNPPPHVFDAAVGYRYRANARSLFVRQDFENLVVTNSLGYRDGEFGEGMDPDRLTIAMVGDSYLAANQVSLAQTWAHLLEEGLARELGFPVEVLNLGMDGYSPWNIAQQLIHDIPSLRPDMVIYWGAPTDGADVLPRYRDIGADGRIVIGTDPAETRGYAAEASDRGASDHLLPEFLVENLLTARLASRLSGRTPMESGQIIYVPGSFESAGEGLRPTLEPAVLATRQRGIPVAIYYRGSSDEEGHVASELGLEWADDGEVFPDGYETLQWPNDAHFDVRGNRTYSDRIAPSMAGLVRRVLDRELCTRPGAAMPVFCRDARR